MVKVFSAHLCIVHLYPETIITSCANIKLYQIIIMLYCHVTIRLDCFLFVVGMSPFKYIKA